MWGVFSNLSSSSHSVLLLSAESRQSYRPSTTASTATFDISIDRTALHLCCSSLGRFGARAPCRCRVSLYVPSVVLALLAAGVTSSARSRSRTRFVLCSGVIASGPAPRAASCTFVHVAPLGGFIAGHRTAVDAWNGTGHS